MQPSDRQILDALLARDEQMTHDFFFVWCRPLFYSLIRKVFGHEVDYDELVNELYVHLMENDGRRLRSFQGRSSIFQWLKCVATRFFLERRDGGQVIEDTSSEPLYPVDEPIFEPMEADAARAEAAAGKRDNRCNVRCEQYVLQRFGITVSETELAERSASANWLKEGGTPLFQMGNLCAEYGLSVARQYDATPDDVRKALADGYEVIVAVDGGEIDGNPDRERVEDAFIGRIPDHSLVILSYGNDVVCYNPFHGETPQMIPEDRFIDAWDDSNCYMVKINDKETVAKTYSPAPLDLSDVTLPESLTELTEAIAENTHEIWSQNRLKEGWTYGPERDDTLLKHPDLLPYSDLPDGEKEYDRATAMNAIKLIVKLGYEIVKK